MILVTGMWFCFRVAASSNNCIKLPDTHLNWIGLKDGYYAIENHGLFLRVISATRREYKAPDIFNFYEEQGYDIRLFKVLEEPDSAVSNQGGHYTVI